MKLRQGSHDRTRRPAAAKAAEGNPGNRPIESLAVSTTAIGQAPDWFSPRMVDLWVEINGMAPRGAFASSDRETITDYCVATFGLRRAIASLAGENDILARRVIMSEVSKWQAIKLALAREMGMTPMARARLAIDDEPAAAERELAALIGM